MVKGAWWHSMHFLVAFQARLSFARKVRPRSIVPLTFGSAARAPNGRITRVRTAEMWRTADLLSGWLGLKRRQSAGGQEIILPGRREACQRPVGGFSECGPVAASAP